MAHLGQFENEKHIKMRIFLLIMIACLYSCNKNQQEESKLIYNDSNRLKQLIYPNWKSTGLLIFHSNKSKHKIFPNSYENNLIGYSYDTPRGKFILHNYNKFLHNGDYFVLSYDDTSSNARFDYIVHEEDVYHSYSPLVTKFFVESISKNKLHIQVYCKLMYKEIAYTDTVKIFANIVNSNFENFGSIDSVLFLDFLKREKKDITNIYIPDINLVKFPDRLFDFKKLETIEIAAFVKDTSIYQKLVTLQNLKYLKDKNYFRSIPISVINIPKIEEIVINFNGKMRLKDIKAINKSRLKILTIDRFYNVDSAYVDSLKKCLKIKLEVNLIEGKNAY